MVGLRWCVALSMLAFAVGCFGEAETTTAPAVPDETREAATTDEMPVVVDDTPADVPQERSSPDSVREIIAHRQQLDETVYAAEVEAQRHEQVFVQLWDSLRNADPWEVLAGVEFDELGVGQAEREPLKGFDSDDFDRWQIDGAEEKFTREEFSRKMQALADDGWKIDQTEWHHEQFTPGEPAKSLVNFEIHAQHAEDSRRVLIRGKLKFTWRLEQDSDELPAIDVVETAGVQLLQQTGPPMFETPAVLDPKQIAPGRFPRVSPLLVHDFNGDGRSEVVLAGCNVLFWNRGDGEFDKDDFLLAGAPHRPLKCGIIADFTGDGHVDFIGGSMEDLRLLLYEGDADGRFRKSPRVCFDEVLENPSVLTAGDIDADGDLDLFVGQWRAPYERGTMPNPYYDANDGPPDFLLLNDGRGQFTDITKPAGLAGKRNRRTYSATLVDLDDDNDQDLLVVADFAGLDLYRNDGEGKFTEVTSELVDQRHAFGMSHTFGDYNSDGRLDFYMIGMSSTTARRLQHLGIQHPGFEEQERQRMPMAYGNRMYLRDGDGYAAPAFADQVARTGWSWGCTSRDFDNDGDVDIYVANGHISGKSSQDYCTKFWCHDMYAGGERPNAALDSFFQSTLLKGLGHSYSWNGYEHNALLSNGGGTAFLNTNYLNGAAFEFDARAVVADDLNRDGKVDLLVVEYFTEEFRERLHIVRNAGEASGNWIGVDLHATAGSSPIGAKVTVEAGGRNFVGSYFTGDSFNAQHSSTLHFGLGKLNKVDAIEIRWGDGRVQRVTGPTINQYHTLARDAKS